MGILYSALFTVSWSPYKEVSLVWYEATSSWGHFFLKPLLPLDSSDSHFKTKDPQHGGFFRAKLQWMTPRRLVFV
ncbi:unnamed protein product [Callosobruchus maculatus]|uniref:Uncharacterized protein n=1 Tax=Callosobruchus maculatus TaxID=64391 RepID=A0A653CSN9_CALMS|nr:unnamed protein product [Callosobruchus maculatus]